jgi:NAD(P)-dependent dehydrogenase (short-subunit alcohol dehydrogenase family)
MIEDEMSKVWFVTGAGRGLGIDIAQKALAAGHSVVATGRNPPAVLKAIEAHESLLTVALDITDPQAAIAAAQTAVDRFGRIDVLVNNAGNFYAGYFENISPDHFRAQMETNFFGPLNVTRTILPIMRAQRSGQVITVTSLAGLIGQEFVVAYAASKFALEGRAGRSDRGSVRSRVGLLTELGGARPSRTREDSTRVRSTGGVNGASFSTMLWRAPRS